MAEPLPAYVLDCEPSISDSDAPESEPDSAAGASGVLRCAARVATPPPEAQRARITARTVAEALTIAARAGRWDLVAVLAQARPGPRRDE